MNRKANHAVDKAAGESNEIDSLYVELLKRYYDEGTREKAKTVAARLEKALAASAELSDSIRGAEIRSLIAELNGDLHEAIRSREAEIRKILELHALSVNTPSWKYVAKQYDFSDVSDRLDLLAILYDRQGDTDRAAATLRESHQYCVAHQIPFDGLDLLAEIEKGRQGRQKNGAPQGKRARKPIAAKRTS